jgi:glycine cleavage system aminomethyltransferase T
LTDATPTKEGPYRVSSVYYKQLSVGANFIRDQYRWIRAERFSEPENETQRTIGGVGLSDISHLGKLDLKSNDIMDRISKELGGNAQIRPHIALKGESGLFRDALICPLTHEEALILSNMSDTNAIGIRLGQADDGCFHVTDLTSYFTGLYLIGPKSREVLTKLTEVNINPDVFSNFAVSELPLLHVQSILLREDVNSILGFQIYFDRAFGEYLWDKIMYAGKEFGIVPVGSSAMKLLGSEWN